MNDQRPGGDVTRSVRYLLIALSLLLAAVLIAFVTIYQLSDKHIYKTWNIEVEPIAVPSDSAAIERGRATAMRFGCTDCHGKDFGSMMLVDDFRTGRIVSSNLTRGEGGIGEVYESEDWVRAIRHGVGLGGRPLVFMPSQDFQVLDDEDLGDLIAYLEQLVPVDRTQPKLKVGLPMRLTYLEGKMPTLLPVEVIDHSRWSDQQTD